MKQPDGGHAPSYNVQITTEAAAKVIVGVEASQCGSENPLLGGGSKRRSACGNSGCADFGGGRITAQPGWMGAGAGRGERSEAGPKKHPFTPSEALPGNARPTLSRRGHLR